MAQRMLTKLIQLDNKTSMKNNILLAVLIALIFGSLASSVYAESRSARRIPEAKCKEFPGSIFKPCICAGEVPKTVKYRPSVDVCGGDAAAILSGQFASSYSVVLRDSQNRDRWPASGYNGCNAAEVEAGLNRCSAFKCQKTIKRKNARGKNETVCCFGESGFNPILAGATRMTIKLRDIPNASNDPLVRVCLNDFDADVNLN